MNYRPYLRAISVAICATYFLIFIGGLVRVAGAGLGCPDWPHCYGGWFPPINEAALQLRLMETPNPTGVLAQADPSHFNSVLPWIEYVNRLVGVTVGFSILAILIVAIATCRRDWRILWGSIVSVLLVAFQGWLGGRVVTHDLNPLLVSIHMGLAIVMILLLIYLAYSAAFIDVPRTTDHPRLRILTYVLTAGGLVQITLGAHLRGTFEHILIDAPLLSDAELFQQAAVPKFVHIGVGVILAAGAIATAVHILRKHRHPLVRFSSWALIVLSALQLILGFAFRDQGLNPTMQLFHLWLASLWIGVIYLLTLTLPHNAEPPADAPHPMRLGPLVAGMAGTLLIACLAFFVTTIAERSRADMEIVGPVPALLLERPDGSNFTAEDFQGKITVVSFGFTRCPLICPAMNGQIRQFYKLYAHEQRLQFVFITTDPEHDTPEQLADYARSMDVTDDRWQFLRSDDIDTLKTIAAKGFYVRDDFPNHATKFVLVDPEGRIRDYFSYDSIGAIEALKTSIRQLAEEYLLP